MGSEELGTVLLHEGADPSQQALGIADLQHARSRQGVGSAAIGGAIDVRGHEAVVIEPELGAQLEERHQIAQVGQGDRRPTLADVGRRLWRNPQGPGEISLLEATLLEQSRDLLVDEDHVKNKIPNACDPLINVPSKAGLLRVP